MRNRALVSDCERPLGQRMGQQHESRLPAAPNPGFEPVWAFRRYKLDTPQSPQERAFRLNNLK